MGARPAEATQEDTRGAALHRDGILEADRRREDATQEAVRRLGDTETHAADRRTDATAEADPLPAGRPHGCSTEKETTPPGSVTTRDRGAPTAATERSKYHLVIVDNNKNLSTLSSLAFILHTV